MPKKLSKYELFFIQENPQNMTAEELSKELGYGVSIIKKYMKLKPELVVEQTQVTPPIQKQIPQEDDALSKFGRRVRNHTATAIVMTEGASQVTDDYRQKMPYRSMREDIKNAIYKPKGNYQPKDSSGT